MRTLRRARGGRLLAVGLACALGLLGLSVARGTLPAEACQPLKVTKTAVPSYTRTWHWTIDKVGDKTQLTLPVGEKALVNYTTKLDAAYVDSGFAVTGTITIQNPNPYVAATITGIADVVSPGIAATVSCGVTFPYTLPKASTLTCTYSAALPDASTRVNTATVSTTGQVAGGSGTADVVFGAPTKKVDHCVDVTDDKYGPLGTVCANEVPKTFAYSMNVGPYSACGQSTFVNVASFKAANTGATGSDSWTVKVDVPCDQTGCTRTLGYWKTHSKYGPAKYDKTWALVGEDTPFFASGKTYLQVLRTAPLGNAYYILAHQYIAAKLNLLSGASGTPKVTEAMAWAETFFTGRNPATPLTAAMRAKAISYAGILDAYNKGDTGPGHCSA